MPYVVFILSFVFVFSALPSFAEEKKAPVVLTYEVYAGGIHAVKTIMTIDKAEKDYNINLSAKTTGWLGSLVPWDGSFASHGVLKDAAFYPKQHQSIATWRGETKTKTFSYEDSAVVSLVIKEDGKKDEIREIDKVLTEDTTDILSAALAVMIDIPKKNKCGGVSDIFDGDRRFTLTFHDEGEAQLTASRYNPFEGPARFCTVEIEPKGGKWHKKPRGWLSIQEQGRQKGALPAVWMGKVDGIDYSVPVKIRVKTDYGTLMMHLTSIK